MKLLLLFLIFTTQLTLAQSVFTGKITDGKGMAVRGVNVTLSKANTGNILAYSITDNAGKYNISFTSTADSLQLNLYALGFAPQQRIVLNKSQENAFVVSEKNIELKEVIVKPDPIKRRGDTLTFNVGEFKDKNDRAIVDIIRKLPGIEVKPSGEILYQGKPINKYYIEGLDLLGGRYSLANENLPADAVSNVQIVENHQPIKMLDSLEFSENAAINIQLKNKITTTGTANLGAGFSPLLWEANVTPMVFTKKNQFIGSYQSNNTGNNIAKQTKVFTMDDMNNRIGISDDKKDWLGIQQLAPPSFADNRWLFNNVHLGSINQLKKLKNDYELRINASYTNDYQQQKGSTTTLFYTPTDTIGIIENKFNQLYFNSLQTNLVLQKNDKKKYFKNELKFQGFWDGQRGNIVRNGEPLIQELSNPYFSLTNELRDIFTVGKQLLTLRSFVTLNRTPQNLRVTPGQFAGLFNNGIPFLAVQQNVNLATFATENSVSLTRSIKGIVFSPSAGFSIQKQGLSTTLTRFNEGQEMPLTGIFLNDLSFSKSTIFTKLSTEYRVKDWRLRLSTPLNFYDYKLRDATLGNGQNLQRLAFEPNFGVSYEIDAFWKVNASVNRSVNLGDVDDVHYGYILRNYRSVERRKAPLPVNISQRLSGGVSYRNPLNSTFANLFYNYSLTDNNLLFSNRINDVGAIELQAIEQQNNSSFQNLSGRLGKYFSKAKLNISAGISLSQQKREQIINDRRALVTYFNVQPNAKVTFNLLSWFDTEYQYEISYLKNSVGNQLPQIGTQQKQELALNFYTKNGSYIGVKNELYRNRFINQNSRNLFTDLVYRYTLSKRKIDLELNWNNVFNLKTLTTVSASSFAYAESTYQLRPSQVLAKVRFSFK